MMELGRLLPSGWVAGALFTLVVILAPGENNPVQGHPPGHGAFGRSQESDLYAC